jgi:SAM-dependent methyltransferase
MADPRNYQWWLWPRSPIVEGMNQETLTPLRDRFVLGSLPADRARILEIGCGDGRLAHAMHRAGHDVTAVDPNAPQEPVQGADGPVFHRGAFEEVTLAAGSFDIAVACMSLHHVDDLGPVLDRAAEALCRGGMLLVAEFGWERIDEPTGRWYAAHLPVPPRPDEGFLAEVCRSWQADLTAGRARPFDAYCEEWATKDEMLHDSARMLRGLRARFAERSLEWVPYLHEGLDATEADEAEAVADGRIQAVGLQFTGVT